MNTTKCACAVTLIEKKDVRHPAREQQVRWEAAAAGDSCGAALSGSGKLRLA